MNIRRNHDKDYKEKQENARLAMKKARNGPAVSCTNCYQPVGKKGSQPAIRTNGQRDQNKKRIPGIYAHSSC